ncbi:PIN2/TERF1-interacting telomerase inhibitor 1 [Neoarius graeffei]|uniref:PIN2/TERF1-interacting telomerase inhibitor 1 n=1 Tax=Neoarius graeffei TaxID=443677 RepID=UPI00298D5DA6|nr:PIN2/TERF1-interacting telomerase inhibitor 1 [Neoarius graeffei]XP_060773636.1 PIN2/TERF1-interacting telomerase inhibitor 1 [Neoarius graeffei]XP_060773638.1 PIN2/TERF1-interacting telomerase inhibitor 1 [Neoarius graeffei]XP_060773639.1 PIN2/TERF1-interacting telomerase inhibitor 1 [Neoarius graeffei]XP_060773640.1 PIN2/TERF1-interacting telomerase inhibitor 1 [Neoarius graeffei]
MSMLAEPRRKQKWSVDPRNSAWSNDDSKFGQKMLERMGWSKGKGLGKSEQGATEHIRVKVKNNSLGLGNLVNNEDNWIAHQDDFNQLLAELNNCHGQNNTEEPSPELTQGFSLEEKSKTSKKRVHYMKFTKGKDLSSRSETDLACIFGKRAKQMRNQDEASNSTDSQEEQEQDRDDKNGPSNPDVELNTVTSALTMQEYFAQRMAQLKKGRAEIQSSASTPETNGNPQSQSATPKSTDDSPNTSDIEESKKRKKKKKKDRKNDQHDDEEKVEEIEEAPVTEEVTVVEQADSDSKKKKKKKKERQAREEVSVEECCVPVAKQDTAGDLVALSTERKKKRKNKETPLRTPTHSANEDDKAGDLADAEVLDKKRKKRKRREQQEAHTEEVVVEKKSKKDKRKKKNEN